LKLKKENTANANLKRVETWRPPMPDSLRVARRDHTSYYGGPRKVADRATRPPKQSGRAEARD